MRILITGGAGFVGSALAFAFRRDYPDADIVAFDNLYRQGSESNVELLQKAGIRFVRGDVRHMADLDALEGSFDLFIEASAEPSVLAGLDGSPRYLLDTNLGGTLNALEFARQRAPRFIFLSTSRVYSIAPLLNLPLQETDTRLSLPASVTVPGVREGGITESFPVDRPRSLYGATKLASELIIQEYAETYRLDAIVNRCGVIAGPGQFGRRSQGVYTLWLAHHYFKKPLQYTGFGGKGKQVRDLMHPLDLYDLIRLQIPLLAQQRGGIFNVGGGIEGSVSLQEWTQICRDVTGNEVPMSSDPKAVSVDIPYYVTHNAQVSRAFQWKPVRSPRTIASDTHQWLKQHETSLRSLFAGDPA